MSFIRGFVGTESGVSVESVTAILFVVMGDGGVEFGNGLDQLRYTLFKLAFGLLILGLVIFKPLAVVVGRNLS